MNYSTLLCDVDECDSLLQMSYKGLPQGGDLEVRAKITGEAMRDGWVLAADGDQCPKCVAKAERADLMELWSQPWCQPK